MDGLLEPYEGNVATHCHDTERSVLAHRIIRAFLASGRDKALVRWQASGYGLVEMRLSLYSACNTSMYQGKVNLSKQGDRLILYRCDGR